MPARLFRLDFSRVHFGVSSLEDSGRSLAADTLFSALCQEALKSGGEARLGDFVSAVNAGSLRLSDALPYVGEELLLPKPIARVQKASGSTKTSDSVAKKQAKKVSFVPLGAFDSFLAGEADLATILDVQQRIGAGATEAKVAVRNGKADADPYRVGVFSFSDNAGLWVLATGAESELSLLTDLLDSLSVIGLGGERTSGLGQFRLTTGEPPTSLVTRIDRQGKAMLLNAALPKEEEMESALDKATYKLIKRSGFVSSRTYADSPLRKRDIYKFAAGSVFTHRFDVQVADVQQDGEHPVYSYAKALWFGLGEK